MEKLVRADVLAPRQYAPLRDERRAEVIALKKRRRVHVGPQVTLVFENHPFAMIAQVEEMARAEGLHEDDKIQAELDIYNGVLPDPGQLAATLFIELTTPLAIEKTLPKLVGLHEHVFLMVGGERVQAVFDQEQFAADKLAAVQYLKFTLDEAARALIAQRGTALAVAIDHPSYRHEARLDDETRAELASDLV